MIEIMETLADKGVDMEMCQELAWNIKRCLACIGTLTLILYVLLIVLLVIKMINISENNFVSMSITVITVVCAAVFMSYVMIWILGWAQTEMIEWVIAHKI